MLRCLLNVPGHNAAGGPTSKLCLLQQVKVPISPMGDAHLRKYIYHNVIPLSSIFVRIYIYDEDIRQKTVEIAGK